jgi:glycerol-3-phosphate dehydrogenase
MIDCIIIGAGVIGTTIARELSRHDLRVLVLDKSSDVANGQTIANSAVVHSGHDPKPGTLKARLSVEGNRMYDSLSKELSFPLLKTGALVLATSQEDIKTLHTLEERARTNGVPDVRVLSREEAIGVEPNITDDVLMALSLPTTKVTYPWEVAFSAMENAIYNGARFQGNSAVTAIRSDDGAFVVTVNGTETIRTRLVVNAAGIFSDEIARMAGDPLPFEITPRKGEYLVLDSACEGFVRHVLYPMPDARGKGVLLIPQVHGNILVGPSSEYVSDKEALGTTVEGMRYVTTHAKRIAKNIPLDKTIRTFAGIRASSTSDDFHIKASSKVPGLFHVAGIDSPGLTAAPAIASYVRDLVMARFPYPPKTSFDPVRTKRPLFRELPEEEKKRLIQTDKRYANIICKCERITEKEIVDAITGPLGSDTIKGIKKRVRAGAGLCQGGYCQNKVLSIIARETKREPTEIDYYEKDTKILLKETKVRT